MRDWVLTLTPVVVALYFLFNPDQFQSTLHWLGQLLQ
jgi:hypothetical protein